MEHTLVPEPELQVFKRLKDIKVVFDIGARADTDYLDIKPTITLHAFEPNPEFFEQLCEKVKGIKGKGKIYLNCYGLGDEEREAYYSFGVQSFEGSCANAGTGDIVLPLKKLDDYVKKNRIKRIDFLKLDTEGYEYKILSSAPKSVALTKYIQYEHWNNQTWFEEILKDFHTEEIGYRNVLCINKRRVPKKDIEDIVSFIRKNEFSKLA